MCFSSESGFALMNLKTRSVLGEYLLMQKENLTIYLENLVKYLTNV